MRVAGLDGAASPLPSDSSQGYATKCAAIYLRSPLAGDRCAQPTLPRDATCPPTSVRRLFRPRNTTVAGRVHNNRGCTRPSTSAHHAS